jgi:hypothetical protein
MMYVASVHLKCFRCFRCMFHMDVAKVDRDITYIAMVVHVRCKHMSPMFHLFFSNTYCKCIYLDVANICCKSFICMFTYVCNGF